MGGGRRAAPAGWRKRAPSREALPLLLLLIALSAVFVFGNDRGHFYRRLHHNNVSGQTLSLAANLSADHRFAMFRSQWLTGAGEPAYEYYNRFPIGPYVLVRLAILPFGDDFPRAIHSARLLMLACFAAAAVLAFLALVRLIGDRWIALTATLLAFSSYYCLYYNDMVSAEGSTSLFGVMLAFHGMTVFAQEGRFRQLLLKTAVAILLGWHVLALAAPFVALGLAGELARAWRGGDRTAAIAAAAARSRYAAYGLFCVLCLTLLLGWNFGSEYLALGGEVPVTELPSVRSMLNRASVSAPGLLFEDSSAYTEWGPFLRGQLSRIGVMATPFSAAQFFRPDVDVVRWPPDSQIAAAFSAVGAAAFGASLAGLAFLRQRMLPAALLLAGWCWALPLRASTGLHDFEAVFYVGVPLALFLPALLGLRRLPGRSAAIPGLAVAALLAFVLSAALMGRVGNEGDAAQAHRDLTADFSAIRETTTGKSLVADARRIEEQVRFPDVFWMLRYYLSGTFLQRYWDEGAWESVAAYDYILAPLDIGGSLTPRNRRTFLYRVSELPGLFDALAAREPALRGAFDVHAEGRTLTYTRSGCAGEDTAARFFLHVVPAAPGDLAPERRQLGFDNLDFTFADRGAAFAGRCVALAELPAYDIALVRTGQFDGGANLWGGSFRVGAPDPDRYAAALAREPALRGAFDVHLEGRTLVYARGECSEEDTAPRFFLHVVPIDAADLPEERRQIGFDNLDFAFADRGQRSGDGCLAAIRLPEYGIARVRTGQHADGGRLWEGEFAFPAGQ